MTSTRRPTRPAARGRALLVLLGLAAALAGVFAMPGRAAADEGWVITRFTIHIDIQATGSINVRETIDVDFGPLQRHGIFRDLDTRFRCSGETERCPEGFDRRYVVRFGEARIDGQPTTPRIEESDSRTRFRLGNPDVTITGQHQYQVTYEIIGALDRLGGLDQLYWNVTGVWDVPIVDARVEVLLPIEAETQSTCYQGPAGSTQRCLNSTLPAGASYRLNGAINAGGQLTTVLGWKPGIVQIEPPLLEERTTFANYFTFDAIEWGALGGLGLLSFAVLGRLWWVFGRDRQFTSLYYLTNNPDEHTRPLFSRRDVVIEYLPPGDWRPAQMGLVLDERADTLDVTATIIDLAVRGYLTITEIPKKGWFGKPDWELTRTAAGAAGADLLEYETSLLGALFEDGPAVRVSELRTKFYEDLARVKRMLYRDALRRHWFRVNPETVRSTWRYVGLGVILAGAGLVVLSALAWSRAIMFVPIPVAGLLIFLMAPSMPRRTSQGSEALRRVLGFRLYVATAETRMQEFNEQQGIFARYLPYAIVFGCVDRWAKAFSDLGSQPEEVSSWYHGSTPLRAAVFASHVNAFSSSLSSAISSTPGSSGGSGFSGGSSGGGGGGGGGGSW